MKIENIKIDDLKPYPKNARKHPEAQIDALKRNIEKFGFTTPVLVDDKNGVIAGHGRIMAMRELKLEEVPCVRISGLTDEEIKALRLADNKITSMSEWDMELVKSELELLPIELGTFIGFDEKELTLNEIDFDNIKSNEDRENQFKKQFVICPKCGEGFDIII